MDARVDFLMPLQSRAHIRRMQALQRRSLASLDGSSAAAAVHGVYKSRPTDVLLETTSESHGNVL